MGARPLHCAEAVDNIFVTVYSCKMSKHKKLLQLARRPPNGMAFSDLKTLMRACGWHFDRQRGSHEIWISSGGVGLSIQNRKGEAKGYQVKQFLAVYDSEVCEHVE